jgi:hypothetical protein
MDGMPTLKRKQIVRVLGLALYVAAAKPSMTDAEADQTVRNATLNAIVDAADELCRGIPASESGIYGSGTNSIGTTT